MRSFIWHCGGRKLSHYCDSPGPSIEGPGLCSILGGLALGETAVAVLELLARSTGALGSFRPGFPQWIVGSFSSNSALAAFGRSPRLASAGAGWGACAPAASLPLVAVATASAASSLRALLRSAGGSAPVFASHLHATNQAWIRKAGSPQSYIRSSGSRCA